MKPTDTYRDAFLKFVAGGMTHAEALDQFDENEWRAATLQELDDKGTRIHPTTHELVTNDERNLPSLLSLGALANFQKRSQKDFEEQAIPLMLAGWTSEVPNPTNRKDPCLQCQTMSLYWRAATWKAWATLSFHKSSLQRDDARKMMDLTHYRNIFATGKRSEVIKAGEELIAELAVALSRQTKQAKRSAFVKPTFVEVSEYMTKIGLNGDNPQAFIDHYESNGWKVGRVGMVSWERACDNWKRNRDKFSPGNGNGQHQSIGSKYAIG